MNKKEGKNIRMGREKLQTPHEAYNFNEHLINEITHPIWTCKFRVVGKRPNECAKKRGKNDRAYN